MTVLKVFLVLQVLLLAARCDVWPRDQELKDGEGEQFKHIPQEHQDGWDYGDPYGYSGAGHHSAGAQKESSDVSETVHYPLEHGHVNPSHGRPSEDLSVAAEDSSAVPRSKNTPMRMGNWCAFVHKREVTMSVACGTEKYIIKSQSPCPNGTPDCHLIMYKLSTRPVYREKQKIFTALLWRCCPGHGGERCEDIVENGHVSESEASSTDIRLNPGGPELNNTGSKMLTHKQNQEQNDHQDSRPLLHDSLMPEENPTEEQKSYDYTPTPHTGHVPHYESSAPYGTDDGHRGPPPETHYANPGLVPIHYLKDVMMSHLQPIFDSFNRTLARLSEEVHDLQKDMSKLQLDQMLQGESKAAGGGIGEESEQHEEMNDTFQQLEEQKMQLVKEMEQKLHAQQAMLHYNLSNLKIDMDVQNKRSQKMLQTGLHALNSSLSEIREKQDLQEEDLQKVLTLTSQIPSPVKQPQEDTAVWEAIARLDNKVVNNTIWLSALNKDQVQVSGRIEHFQKGWKNLEERITQNDHKNEERYIEAFLEVDAAKVTVGKYADELAKNFTNLQSTVQELEEDMDDLYTQFHKNISLGSRDCDCTGLSTSVVLLKQAVANIQVIASENRQALDSAAEEKVNIWENRDWGPQVEEIKLGLHTVQNSLMHEQEKRKILQQTLNTLQTSLLASQINIEALQQQDSQKAGEIKHLYDAFNSLLKDAIRHSDILTVLLGEEVLEFMDWSAQAQEAYSIPALKTRISDLQEQINGHGRSLASMLNSEDPTAGQLSERVDWIEEDLNRKQKEQKFDHSSEEPASYKDKDLFALEKTVEQLRAQVVKLGEQKCLSCCNSTKGAASKDVEGELQAELARLRKNLDDHLRIFSSIFSNTEGLTESEATVDLDKLFALIKKKEAKLQRKRQKKKADTRSAQRSKRDTSGEIAVHSQLPENPFMFVASSRDGANTPGLVVFESTSVNHGQIYSPETGMFRAPAAGVYLFVLTLDFGSGPSLAQLKRGEEVAASLDQRTRKPSGPTTRICLLQLQQGEEVHVELVQGTLEHGKPKENTFAGLLLLQTT